MKSFEKVHPHPSAEMHCQADRRMCDRQNARPDANIPPQIEASGVWPLSQNIPWTEPQCNCPGSESHMPLGSLNPISSSRHDQSLAAFLTESFGLLLQDTRGRLKFCISAASATPRRFDCKVPDVLFTSNDALSIIDQRPGHLLRVCFMSEFQATEKLRVERDDNRGDAHGHRAHAHR